MILVKEIFTELSLFIARSGFIPILASNLRLNFSMSVCHKKLIASNMQLRSEYLHKYFVKYYSKKLKKRNH